MIKYAFVLITLLALTNSLQFLANNEAVENGTISAVEYKFTRENEDDLFISIGKSVENLKMRVSCEVSYSRVQFKTPSCSIDVRTVSGKIIESINVTTSVYKKLTISYDYVLTENTNYEIKATIIDDRGREYERRGYLKRLV